VLLWAGCDPQVALDSEPGGTTGGPSALTESSSTPGVAGSTGGGVVPMPSSTTEDAGATSGVGTTSGVRTTSGVGTTSGAGTTSGVGTTSGSSSESGGTSGSSTGEGSSSEESTGEPVPLDEDEDGVFTPLDCDDADPRVFPGQTEFFDTPRVGLGGFDFDCDGDETFAEPEYVECNPPVCGSAPGWSRLFAIPDCGAIGHWDSGYCQVEWEPGSPPFCSGNAPPTSRTQRCR